MQVPLDSHKGFTLIELVIAITLLGITLALAYGAMHVATRSQSSVSAVQSEVEELRTSYNFLRRHLEQAINPASGEANLKGESDQLHFVAPVPMRALNGGRLYQFHLIQHQTDDQRNQLILTYSPLDSDDQTEEESLVLAETETALQFSYLDSLLGHTQPQWEDVWDIGALPSLVRLEAVTDSAGGWPEQIFSIRKARR